MKETKYYCDVTGEEITGEFDVVTVTVVRPDDFTPGDEDDQIVHIGPDSHSLDTTEERPRNGFTAYIGDTGTVAMIEEETPRRTRYYGQDTTDSEIADLVHILQSEVLDDAD